MAKSEHLTEAIFYYMQYQFPLNVSVGEVADAVGVSRSTARRHLEKLYSTEDVIRRKTPYRSNTYKVTYELTQYNWPGNKYHNDHYLVWYLIERARYESDHIERFTALMKAERYSRLAQLYVPRGTEKYDDLAMLHRLVEQMIRDISGWVK